MSDFRRYFVAGGTYFFTVVTAGRAPIFRNAHARALLGKIMRKRRLETPFETVAVVLLPDHLHTIRDERDLHNHADYIHYNPVKHGHAGCPKDWPWSSFRRYVQSGDYAENWGSAELLPPEFGDVDPDLLE